MPDGAHSYKRARYITQNNKAMSVRAQHGFIIYDSGILHGDPSEGICHGTCQNNGGEYRTQIFDHEVEDLPAAEGSFPVHHLFLNGLYPDDTGYQQADGDGRNGHHHGVGQEIEEIQELHADDLYSTKRSVTQ